MNLTRWSGNDFPNISRPRLIIATLLLSLAVLFLVGLWVVERQLNGPVSQWAETHAVNIATGAINRAVGKSLSGGNEGSLIKPLVGGLGISYDWPKINRIKTEITESVLADLQDLAEKQTPVPLGLITGFMPLSSIGPRIPIRVIPVGSVTTDLRYDFLAAGINQVIHRIYVDVKVSMRVIAPFVGTEFDVHEQIPITTELIQGEVPSTYINWSGSLQELERGVVPFTTSVPFVQEK